MKLLYEHNFAVWNWVFCSLFIKRSQQEEVRSNIARGTLNQNSNKNVKIFKSYKLQDLKLITDASDEVTCDIISYFLTEC